MNIFFLDKNPNQSAIYMCDKHVVKMIVESAQMLSTAHRVLDGQPTSIGKKTINLLNGEIIINGEVTNSVCYKMAHANHPCTVWTRENKSNYLMHFKYLLGLLDEYTYRYNKKHSVEGLVDFLSNAPQNITDLPATVPPQCMPDQYKISEDVVESYRAFYAAEKFHFSKWTGRKIPFWYFDSLKDNFHMNQDALEKLFVASKKLSADINVILLAQELIFNEHI